MLKKILSGLAVVILLLVIVVALQPNDFRVERSINIAAPAPQIFIYLNNARKMNEWSPWTKLDPQMKQTYEGPESGVGASASWSGNKDVGEGRQTIVESKVNELVRTKLEFFKPVKGVNTADFSLKPEEDGITLVTWSMYGPKNFVMKAMGLVMSCDKMMGGQFEEGLNNLKAIVEKV